MADRRQKTCTKCGKEQTIENFRPNGRSKDKLDYWCNQCNSDKNKKWLENSEKGKLIATRKKAKAKIKRQENPEIGNEACKKWYRENKEQKQKIVTAYQKKKNKEDIQWQLRNVCRKRIRCAIQNTGQKKTTSTTILLGCSIQELRTHLESLFTEGMMWVNYGRGIGKWSIDHIKPCVSFDLTDLEQQMQCFHYSNLQPLWFEENSRKGARLIY